MFCDVIKIIVRIKFFQFVSVATYQANLPIVKFECIAGFYQSKITGAEYAELVDIFFVLLRPIINDGNACLMVEMISS